MGATAMKASTMQELCGLLARVGGGMLLHYVRQEQ
jgi:hypothetical protein